MGGCHVFRAPLADKYSGAWGNFPTSPCHRACDKGIVQRVHMLTANANKLNTNLPCTHITLDRDTTKLALLEFPAVNPISKIFHVPETNTLIDELSETHTLTQHNYTLSPESIHSGSIPCKKDRKE